MIFPFFGDLRTDIDPCPYVLAPLCVMSGRGDEGMGPVSGPLYVLAVKGTERGSKPFGASAHLIQGKEAIENIKGTVLKSLRHHRPGDLLKSHDKIEPFLFVAVTEVIRKLEQKDISEVIKY